jgi:hypothetical protein
VNWPFGIYRPLSAPARNSLIRYRRVSTSSAPKRIGFDGKSDGKNFFVILFLIFTVKPDLKLLKSLQLTGFFALQIVGLRNS